MWVIFLILLSAGINFCVPHTKNEIESTIEFGFPFNYYPGEHLTVHERNYRIKVIYITCMTYVTITSTLIPSTYQAILPIPSIEKSVTKDRGPHEKALLDLSEIRGGGESIPEIIFEFLVILIMSLNYRPTQGFQPKPNPHFGGRDGLGPAPRIAPKLHENLQPRNNLNPGQGNCRSSQHPSLDELANSLTPEYREFQSKYYSDSLPKRFDTKNYSIKKFKELAIDPRSEKYTRIGIDEARAIVQADLENLIIKPSRFDMETAKRVDLDFKVEGPAPFTHLDVKTPVGSSILKKQNRTTTIEDMSYQIGRKIVDQKKRFLGLENGPITSENVGHLVDLSYVANDEKPIVREKILEGARDRGSDTGIIFLNDIQ